MTESQSEQRHAYAVRTLETTGEAPARRGGATLTQAENGGVYLIGGANREAQSFGDVLRFDLVTGRWTFVSTIGEEFPARSGHSAVAVGPRIYVFGGMNAIECALYEDVLVFDTFTQQWAKPLVEGWMPAARNAHAAIRLPPANSHERVLIYGGSSPEEGAFGDVYILHIPTDERDAPLRWEPLECGGAEVPEARELHVATFLNPTTILFSGGRNKDGNVCTDMALLDIGAWEWQLVPICEWNRCSHVAGSVHGAIVSFGGFDGTALRNDCWEYAENEESWLRAIQASASGKKGETYEPQATSDESLLAERFGHCGCSVQLSEIRAKASTHQEALLIFGGMNSERDLNDLVLISPIET